MQIVNVPLITPITPKNRREEEEDEEEGEPSESGVQDQLQEQFGRSILLQLPQNEEVSLSLSLSLSFHRFCTR